jgi:hypothetical protein
VLLSSEEKNCRVALVGQVVPQTHKILKCLGLHSILLTADSILRDLGVLLLLLWDGGYRLSVLLVDVVNAS